MRSPATLIHRTTRDANPGTPAQPHDGALLTILIPFYNEEAVLPFCLERLRRMVHMLDLPCELLFVDDGGSDGGAAWLARQAPLCPEMRLLRLSRNFGKEAAMTAGLDHARGDAVVVLDADLQDPPELILEMVARWRQGADVVLMKRRTRAGETLGKRLTSYLYYRLLNAISDFNIPPDTGDFRLLSRNALLALRQLPERNRYMKGLFAWVGMETAVIEYDRAARASGVSKLDYLALVRLAIEGITSFSITPLRWAAVAGVLAAAASGLFGLWIVIKAMLWGDAVHGYPSLISVITFFGGIQLLTIGILGEYVGKAYLEAKQRPNYLVREVVEGVGMAAHALRRSVGAADE